MGWLRGPGLVWNFVRGGVQIPGQHGEADRADDQMHDDDGPVGVEAGREVVDSGC